MKFNLSEFGNATAESKFTAGDTVTITLIDKDGNDVTPASPDDECRELSGGIFDWPYANLASAPTEYERYIWTMTNQAAVEKTDVDVFSTGPGYFFLIPFDIDITSESINKGDAFNFDFRFESNIDGLEVVVAFEDGETTDSVVLYKKTANLSGGGDDQVLRIAGPDYGFQIFRVFLSGDETELFTATRFMDVKITVTIPNGSPQTVKKKIPFTQVSAINSDLVP